MAGLVPFNRRNDGLMNMGFDGFHNMLDDFFAQGWPFARSLAGDTFKVDVKEDETTYTVEADLPGINREDISVTMDENRLCIAISRDERVDDEGDNYVHRERRCSSMRRTILLADADAQGIKARLADGVLTVNVPKADRKSNTINIDVE
jgi:HSP20 family protein